MSAWAKPGVKCVKFRRFTPQEFRDFKFIKPETPIPTGAVVTISEVFAHPVFGVTCLRVSEFPNIDPSGFDCGWWIGNFRPLIAKTQGQDVALFRHILDGLPVGEDANA